MAPSQRSTAPTSSASESTAASSLSTLPGSMPRNFGRASTARYSASSLAS
ncbi:MAG: hypothetical protein KA978_06515 [Deltaproteobacteria bacterium]|nr:hypothetical protein [Deltaproteobacteria bacterium]MBP6830417.1 hypothetical protein [Deltaproteobacteria bacterium]